MLKKIFDLCLKLSCGAIGVVLLFISSMSTGSLSLASVYEYEMPANLIPHECK